MYKSIYLFSLFYQGISKHFIEKHPFSIGRKYRCINLIFRTPQLKVLDSKLVLNSVVLLHLKMGKMKNLVELM
jgi:hypothetical protein